MAFISFDKTQKLETAVHLDYDELRVYLASIRRPPVGCHGPGCMVCAGCEHLNGGKPVASPQANGCKPVAQDPGARGPRPYWPKLAHPRAPPALAKRWAWHAPLVALYGVRVQELPVEPQAAPGPQAAPSPQRQPRPPAPGTIVVEDEEEAEESAEVGVEEPNEPEDVAEDSSEPPSKQARTADHTQGDTLHDAGGDGAAIGSPRLESRDSLGSPGLAARGTSVFSAVPVTQGSLL